MNIYFKILLTFLILSSNPLFAQDFTIEKNETIDQLVDKKFKVNNTFSIYTNYSLQLISSSKEVAENIYENFTKKYPKEEATIIYAQPNFKVLVGNYRNKIEATHFLKKIKDEYPNAFVVRLKK